jgi:succinyl-diaminopimelate desuccinylase
MHYENHEPFNARDTLLWLCSIASPTGEEQELCNELASYFDRLGIPADRIRRHGNSLYVELSRGQPGPAVALVGHTDVVRTQHDEPPHIVGDRLYGPGASDMKSGLSLMLGIAARPASTSANLSLVFYASEEGRYQNNELGLVVAAEPSLRDVDFALVLEPTDSQLQLGCGGTLHANVCFEGKSAHSARPWQGKNAIYQSLAVLSRLASLEPVPRTVEGFEWITSMSATMAQGGRAPNVIPDQFQLNVNARFAPDQTPIQVEDEIRRLVRTDGEVRVVDCSPAAPPHRDHPLVRLLEQAGARGVAPKLGWTDVGRFAGLDIAAANFGPGTLSQAHQRNEWTSIGELLYANTVLRRWLERMPRNGCSDRSLTLER